jgi:hypothetical protein
MFLGYFPGFSSEQKNDIDGCERKDFSRGRLEILDSHREFLDSIVIYFI